MASSLALLTDLYELTMAFGYWKTGTGNKEAVFDYYFRQNPFNGGFTILCGLHSVIDYLRDFRFQEEDLAYLAGVPGNDGRPLFDAAFLKYLRELRMECDVDAIPEGTVVFPQEPLIRVQGPILQAQLVESLLLNTCNFETLIATKAARVCLAARREPVIEFGLRRAQGMDGALSASRASYIGGCVGTSNVLAGKMFGIPVKGTHAHSWVMSFDNELTAFREYAAAMPNNCLFLVDTYNTVEGVRNAIQAGRELRAKGHELIGIRLDSGDLAYLSKEARKMLDEAGFPKAAIIASNDLDETIIDSLKDQGARINLWGVGTKLVTGYEDAALGGVYKISAIRLPGHEWEYKIKLSEQVAKISNPGIHQVRRYYGPEGNIGDVIYDTQSDLSPGCVMVDPMDQTRRKQIGGETAYRDLLVPIFRKGTLVYKPPELNSIRDHAAKDLAGFHEGIKRFVFPHRYPVGLEKSLFDLKTELILQLREVTS